MMQAALDSRIEEVRGHLKGDAADPTSMDPEPVVSDLMEHDRSTGARPKRRR